MLIKPEQHTIEVAGRTMAYRSQVPLLLAWAVSVHKSQVNLCHVYDENSLIILANRNVFSQQSNLLVLTKYWVSQKEVLNLYFGEIIY